jgi:aminoglycoside phosphotransferase (APT) family kinase protein
MTPENSHDTEHERGAAGLSAFLCDRLPEVEDIQISGLRRNIGGLSRENWPFDVEWTERDVRVRHALIMRRDPVGSVLETDREIEFRVLKALEAASVPAPRARWIDATGMWLERPFVIMDRYEGVNDHLVLEGGISQLDQPSRLALARRYCETLAQIHTTDWESLGLGEVLKSPGLYGAAAALEEWERYLEHQALEPQPELTEVLCWLRRNLPTAQATVLVHGDFKPGNTLLREGNIEVLLDWETAHLGDPMEDIGWVTNPLRRREHLIPGLWEREDLLAYYSECSGFSVDEDSVHFWNVLANLKLAAIYLTGVRSFCEGRSDRVWTDSRALPGLLFQMIGH